MILMEAEAQKKSENNKKNTTTGGENARVAVFTLGCKVNQYESQSIVASLCAVGIDAVEGLTSADIYVINTCSVTCEADKKSRQAVARALRQNPNARIIVAGCSSQNDAQSFLDKPQVVSVFGSGGKIKNITEAIKRILSNQSDNHKDSDPVAHADFLVASEAGFNSDQSKDNQSNDIQSKNSESKNFQTSYIKSKDNQPKDTKQNKNNKCNFNPDSQKKVADSNSFEIPTEYEDDMTPATSKTRAYIKIQDGCNNFCTYCRIPYLRGRSRSRPLISVVAECENLSQFAKEIVITGIDISSYGKDIGTSLVELLGQLHKNPNKSQTESTACRQPPRKRLGSLECGIITEDLLNAMQNAGFCDHFHLSLQSGSDTVLARMNRHYTTGEFLKKIDMIRKFFPYAGITTDIIAGFSEETDEEHKQTLEFIHKAEFSGIHVFPYSPRKGTKAYNLPLVDKNIRESRAREIALAAEKLCKRFIQKNLGRVCQVYAEQQEGGYTTGFTSNYIKVYTKLACGDLKPQRLEKIYQKGVIGKDV